MTDLRGTGFLGLVHLLYFLMDARTVSLALEIYRLSQDEVQVHEQYNLATNQQITFVLCLW